MYCISAHLFHISLARIIPYSLWFVRFLTQLERVSNFVESSFESSFELLEFVNDDILLQQRFSIFAYNYVVHLHISSA